MSLTFDLTPAEEALLEDAAHQKGVPVTDYAHGLFAAALRQQIFAPKEVDEAHEAYVEAELRWAQQVARDAFKASGKTDDEIIADTEAAVKAYRAEYAQSQQEFV